MRSPGIMHTKIFERSLNILQELCNRNTQQEINLNGNGESTLDDKLIERIKKTKKIMGDRIVSFCTNGINMTPDKAKQIKDSGLDFISLSPHSPFHARRAAHILNDNGVKLIINYGAICASHNWAGQLEPENSINCLLSNSCLPLLEGRGYISSEGYISPCCYDYKLLGTYGHVQDKFIFDQDVRPFQLCHTCHQRINPSIQQEYGFIQ